MISIISAIGENNEIGKNNGLLWNMPADLKHFKEKTSGHPIIMGQKTYKSIGRPLPNRRNIILTRDKKFQAKGIEIIYSPEEIHSLFSGKLEEEVFIIGGGQIYQLFINKADKLYITHIEAKFPDADTFFPIIEESKWRKISEEKHSLDEKNNHNYSFVEYIKK